MKCPKKRILFVNGNLHVGGIERSLIDLLTHLDYSLYDVDLFLLEEVGELKEQLPSNVHLICANLSKTYGSFIRSSFINISRGKFKLVLARIIILLSHLIGNKALRLLCQVFGVGKEYDCAIAYRVGFSLDIVSYGICSKKKICWWHNGLCNYNSEEIDSIQRSWDSFDYIVAVSKGCKQMILSAFPKLLPEKVIVIPNMVDIDRISALAGSATPYPSYEGIKIVTVGRLCWEKHIEDIPQIASELIKRGINEFKWYIVGDGNMREQIEEEIRKYSVEDYVYLLGSKSNPYPYIKFADMMVHTSHVESQGLTILEAMALKTPCVAVASMGPKEYMNDSNGYIVSMNMSSIAETLFRAIKDLPCKIKTNNAYETVYNNYSPSLIIKKLNGLIEL